MMSKTLLSHSLSSVYRDLMLGEEEYTAEDKKALEEEIRTFAEDSSVFTDKEIDANLEQLDKIDFIREHQDFTCYTDGIVATRYDDPEAREGKRVCAGAAFTVQTDKEILFEHYFAIPNEYADEEVSSHIAEYQALISCLRTLAFYHPDPSYVSLEMYTDSKILANQMTKEYRTRNKQQKKMQDEANHFIDQFKDVNIQYIPREQNQRADELAKKSIEEKEFVMQELFDDKFMDWRKLSK